jgi:hypothetical protein
MKVDSRDLRMRMTLLVSQRVFAWHASNFLQAAHDVVDEAVGEFGAHRRLLDLLLFDLEVFDDRPDGGPLFVWSFLLVLIVWNDIYIVARGSNLYDMHHWVD